MISLNTAAILSQFVHPRRYIDNGAAGRDNAQCCCFISGAVEEKRHLRSIYLGKQERKTEGVYISAICAEIKGADRETFPCFDFIIKDMRVC